MPSYRWACFLNAGLSYVRHFCLTYVRTYVRLYVRTCVRKGMCGLLCGLMCRLHDKYTITYVRIMCAEATVRKRALQKRAPGIGELAPMVQISPCILRLLRSLSCIYCDFLA